MTDQRDKRLQPFQAVFGVEILQDQSLITALESALYARLTIGDPLTKTGIQSDMSIVLLEGKIRVLQKTPEGKERTAYILKSGDIWDLAFMESGDLSFLTASQSLLCQIPTKLVANNPILRNAWEVTQQKSPRVPVLPSAAIEISEFIETKPLQLQADEPPKPKPSTQIPAHQDEGIYTAWSTINQALLYYQCSTPGVKESFFEIHTVEDLTKVLNTYGLKAQKRTYTWAQLLNTDYPLILRDETGRFCWITGRQGNTLLQDQGMGQSRFIPKNVSSRSQFTVLFLKPIAAKKASFGFATYSLGWYITLCLQNWFLSFQMVLASLLIQVFALGTPLFYMVIFDRVFGRQNLSTLDIMTVGIVILTLFDLVVRLMRAYILSHQLEWIDKASMEAFLERLFQLSMEKVNPQSNRGLAERFPELTRMNQVLASTLLMTSLDVVFSIILVIFLLMLHTPMALISLASLVPIGILAFSTSPRVKKRAVRFGQEQRVCQLKLAEVIENTETIQSLNAGNILKWNIAEKIEDHLHKGFAARFDRVCGPTGQTFIATMGAVATLYFGAHEVLQGEISYGVYMAINMISRQVVGSVQRLLTSLVQFQEAMGTLEQFKPLNVQAGEIPDKPASKGIMLIEVSGSIRFNDVRFRYAPDQPWVLDGLNLEIEPGEKIVLTGKSGSGKTTMIRLLQRLYEPHSGYISLDGFNLGDLNIENLRYHVGVALQKPALFAGTIRENIMLGHPSASPKDILEAANLAQLDQDLLRLPKGLEFVVAPLGANLSGGQVARIALARILLMRPGILILDEALAPCDPTLKATIYAQILERYKDATCIFVTDYLPVHQRADRIVVLHEGQVAEQGTYEELARIQSYYCHLHYAQMPKSGTVYER